MSKETTTKKRKKKFGDRYEGRRLRTLAPMTYVAPYIMVNRSGASNLIRDSIALDDLKYYIANKRHEGLKGFGAMYIFIAAYIRAVSQYPGINRFLSGQKIYARNNIEVLKATFKEQDLPYSDLPTAYPSAAAAHCPGRCAGRCPQRWRFCPRRARR